MDIQKPNQIAYEYPSDSYLLPLKMQRFETLNQAVNLIHKASASEGRLADRFKLKSFDGKNVHLFQCWKQECKSHIIFKSHLTAKSGSKKRAQFQILSINNTHNHKDPRHLKANQRKSKHFNFVQKGSDSEEIQIDKLEYIRHRLRRYNISNYFRDYINSFSSSKHQNPNQNLPYILPEIFRYKPFLVTLKIGYKCLNEKKKTYFFIIELFSFGQLYTEVKFITSLKTKNPQIYLYTLTLIYTLLNNIRNCAIFMEEQLFRVVTRTKRDASQLLAEKKGETQKFIKFFLTLESENFIDCTQNAKSEKISHQGHIQRHYIQKSQRQYDRRKYFLQDSEHSHDSFVSTDEEKNKFGLSPFMKKSYIKLQQMELRQVRSIKNKCLIAQTTYKQATMGKNGEWHICEEKPSVMQRINDVLHIQEVTRLKKKKSKEITICKDTNFIALSSDEQEDRKVQEKMNINKNYLEKQQNKYLNHVLSEMFGDIQFKEIEEKEKMSPRKKSEHLVLISSEDQKVQNVNESIKPKGKGVQPINFKVETIQPIKFKMEEIKREEKQSILKFKKESSSSSSSSESSSSSSQESNESSSESEDSDE